MLEHILVVEDDEFMRLTLETELETAGYRVSLAENGQAAIELARQQHFDLIICDIRMPGLNGLETLSALRAHQPEARNIVVTGYADPDAPITAVKLKVDDYLMKPFTSEQFLASVRKSLEGQLQELRKRRSTQKLREVFLHALERGQDRAPAARALRLARELGLSPARAQSLQLAAWLDGMEDQLDGVEELKTLIAPLQESRQSGQLPLEARILRCARQPGPEDAELTAALENESEQPPSLPGRSLRSLLSVARSYLDSGHLEVAAQALDQAAGALGGDQQEAVSYWLLRAELERAQQGENAAASALQAQQLAEQAGLEGPRAQAALLLAELGQGQPEDLRRARRVFARYENLSAMAEAELALAELGDPQELLAGLGTSELWERQPARLQAVLRSQLEQLSPAVRQAGERALPLLEQWLGSDSEVEIRLKALDLIAQVDTPAAHALLGRASGESSKVVALKSGLLLQKAGAQPQLQARLLGRFRLQQNGQTLPEDLFNARKVRSLFAYLAWRRGQETGEENLIDMFWQQNPEKARHSLHNAVSQLRKTLRPLLGELGLVKTADGYVLEKGGPLWVDSEQFLQHCEEARRLPPAEAAAELRKAEALYSGDFLEGNYEEWTEPIRSRLREELVRLLSSLARHYFQAGKHEISLDYWRRLLQLDNCNEDAYLGCMLCQLELGQQAEAVRTYHTCAQKLREELNLAPPPRIVETYLKLLG